MNTTTPHTPATAAGTTPVVPSAMTRGLGRGVLLANGGAILLAAVVLAAVGRHDYWPAFVASAVVGLLGAAASVAVLSAAAGRTVDWLVNYVMAASGVRLGVSLVGLLVAVKGFNTAPEVTGLLVCSFFILTLVVESVRLHAAVRGPVGETHV